MHSFFVDAACFDVVVVQGKDAERFLQGQLTCDVAALADGSQSYGACCNNKGRVIAAFAIVRFGEVFYLCMAKGVGNLFMAALKKFLPFYKCTLAFVDEAQRLYGVNGALVNKALSLAGSTTVMTDAKAQLTDDGWICAVDGVEPRALWLNKSAADKVENALQYTRQGNELETWEALSLLAGHFPFHAEDTERYTPQELHYDQNGYVSFTKGCYTGQEIVARMHYRGKQKKQLFLLRLRPTTPLLARSIALQDKAGVALVSSLLIRTLDSDIIGLIQLPHDFATPVAELQSPEGIVIDLQPFTK